MHHANSIIKHKNCRALVSFMFLFTATNCLATTSLTDSLGHITEETSLTDSMGNAVHHNTQEYRYRVNASMSLAGLPWIVAGIALRSEKRNIREVRNKFQLNFHQSADNYIQYAPLLLTTGLKVAGVEGRSSLKRYAVSSAASLIIMATLVETMKYSVRELRPDGSTNNSFPSGHTATAFSAATILHKEYGMTRSPWYSIAGYMLATATGCMRVLNNRHWASDTFAGAGIGILSTEMGYTLGDLLFKNKGLLRHDRDDELDLYKYPSFFNVQMGIGLSERHLDFMEHLPGLNEYYHEQKKRKIKLSRGIAVGVESAYFLNRYIGLGGRLMITSRNVKGYDKDALHPIGILSQLASVNAGFLDSYTLTVESNHMAEFNWSGGVYFNFPISKRFALGSKLLVGRSYLDGIAVTAEVKGHQRDIAFEYDPQHGKTVPTLEIKGNGKDNGKPYYSKWNFFQVGGDNATIIGTGLSATFAYKSRMAWKVFLDYNFVRRTYRSTYAPTLFLKDAGRSITLNGQTINNISDYIAPYVASQKKSVSQPILGAAFSLCC